MKQPIVSIIIPMYNVAKYLPVCLQSIKAQNFSSEFLEIILIDDGSPDNSYEIAQQLTTDLDNAKIIRQKNKGLGGARNTGIQNATGKYLIFLDADDRLLKNDWSMVVNSDVDILQTGFRKVDENGKVLESVHFKNSEETSGVIFWTKGNIVPSACNKIYRRQFLLENNLFFKERIYSEDIEFNTRAFFLAKKVVQTSLILQDFVQTTGSITRNTSAKQKTKMFEDLNLIISSLIYFRDKNSTSHIDNIYFNRIIADIAMGAVNFSLNNQLGLEKIYNLLNTLKTKGIMIRKISYPTLKKKVFAEVISFPFVIPLLYKLRS